MGCSGLSKYGLIVTLKSPQILMSPLGFLTGTIGAAQSLYSIFSITPLASNLFNSCVIPSFNANGTGRGLKKMGWAPSFIRNRASISTTLPRSSLNTSL